MAGDRLKAEVVVRVEAPVRPGPRRQFSELGLEGHEMTYDGLRWARAADPEAFADYVQDEGDRRAAFIDETQRRGKVVRMKRTAGTPIEIITTSFPPWLSEWVASELRTGRNPRPQIARVRAAWARGALDLLDGQRYVLGFAFHADTDDLHLDLCVSRQDGNGGRIGKSGLGLVGPWCTAVDRQVRAGAEISQLKRTQLGRSVANFRRREGQDAVPLDVRLARILDAAADHIVGPILSLFKTAYATSVPTLERLHAEAELAALDAARERVARGMHSRRNDPAPVRPEIDL
jgi:hypothetical protein